MRFVVIDQGLASRTGHHYNYDAALLEEARRHGLNAIVMHNITLDRFDLPIPAVPLFASSPYGKPEDEAIGAINALDIELARLSPKNFSSDDILFFPILLPGNLLSIASWLERLYAATSPRVVLQLWSGEFGTTEDPARNVRQMEILRTFTERLAVLDDRRILVLCTEFDRRPAIKEALGATVNVCEQYVNMVPSRYLDLPDRSPGNGERVFGFFGHGTWNKGIDFVAPLAKTLLASDANAHFVAHVDLRYVETTVAPGTRLRREIEEMM